ncbi:MAG: hypothetical protein FJW39_20530, partial [Acidobacteria bacterium]|nr:hypothetical protein [Acidobacteriota bacterium]
RADAFALLWTASIAAQEHKVDWLPRWLSVGAEQRTRYESIDRRYNGFDGGDQQLAVRNRFQADVSAPKFAARLELQHSPAYLHDSGSLVTPSHIGGGLLQQANLAFQPIPSLSLEAGRFSEDFGSRRLIARNIFRNSTNAFDGALIRWKPSRWSVQTMVFRPAVYTGTYSDPLRVDGRFAAAFADRTYAGDSQAGGYVIRYSDSPRSPAALDRRLWTTGFRLFRPPLERQARTDYDFETALQKGSAEGERRTESMLHASADHTFAYAQWPRLAISYQQASGAFDTLFGARRFEYGPTGIYGLFARSNIRSLSQVFGAAPTKRTEFQLSHRWMWLASATRGWAASVLADPTGSAGTSLGRQWEARARYYPKPSVMLEAGHVAFHEGSFIERVLKRPAGLASYFWFGIEIQARFYSATR